MQQLRLGTESTSENIATKSSNNSSILVLIPVLAPLLLVVLSSVYYVATMGFSFAAIRATSLTLFLIFLSYQIFMGIARLVQMSYSLSATRRNTLSRKLNSRFTLVDSPKIKPVSILLWTQNRSYGLIEALKSLLSLNYPDYEIILINDGSTDDTMAMLAKEFGLQPLHRVFRKVLPTSSLTAIYSSLKYPILTVLDKPATSYIDSLNIGINMAKAPLVCIVEPDHILARDALLLLAKPFIEHPMETLLTTGLGEDLIENDDVPFTYSMHHLERKRLFHISFLDREAFSIVNTSKQAVCLIRKAELIEIGGLSEVSSDLEISIQLQKLVLANHKPYRVNFIPDILCWKQNLVETPHIKEIYSSWQAQSWQTLTQNLNFLTIARDRRAVAYLWLLLECLAPILEIFGLIVMIVALILGAISLEMGCIFLLVVITFGLFEGLMGITADEFSLRNQHSLAEVVSLILGSVIQSVFYRSLSNLWRIQGSLSLLLNRS